MKKEKNMEQVNAGVLAAVENKNYDYSICETALDYTYMWYVKNMGCNTYTKNDSWGTGEVGFYYGTWEPDTSWCCWYESIEWFKKDIKDAMGINFTTNKKAENLMVKAIEIAHPNIKFYDYDSKHSRFHRIPRFIPKDDETEETA